MLCWNDFFPSVKIHNRRRKIDLTEKGNASFSFDVCNSLVGCHSVIPDEIEGDNGTGTLLSRKTMHQHGLFFQNRFVHFRENLCAINETDHFIAFVWIVMYGYPNTICTILRKSYHIIGGTIYNHGKIITRL